MRGTPSPCEVCGQPTASSLGVCQRPKECRREYARRQARSAGAPRATCEVCGQPLNRDNETGFCSRNAECLRRQFAATRQMHRKAAERTRKWLAKPDRPCRYAKAGCREFAAVGNAACVTHRRADIRRQTVRRRRNLAGRLAEIQGWTCTWCLAPLPTDLRDTHLDHVIPVSCGGPDEDWNLQVLHSSCNHSKCDKVTDLALRLAAERGVTIARAVPRRKKAA